jgi:hypothetical protein
MSSNNPFHNKGVQKKDFGNIFQSKSSNNNASIGINSVSGGSNNDGMHNQ